MVGSHTFWWQEWKPCFSQYESESGAGTRKTGFERVTSVLPLCKLFTKVVTRVIQVITPAKTARIAIKLMTGVKMLFFPRKGNWIWAQKLSLWGAPAMHGSSCSGQNNGCWVGTCDIQSASLQVQDERSPAGEAAVRPLMTLDSGRSLPIEPARVPLYI